MRPDMFPSLSCRSLIESGKGQPRKDNNLESTPSKRKRSEKENNKAEGGFLKTRMLRAKQIINLRVASCRLWTPCTYVRAEFASHSEHSYLPCIWDETLTLQSLLMSSLQASIRPKLNHKKQPKVQLVLSAIEMGEDEKLIRNQSFTLRLCCSK
ncbi:conserved hypothetical protein [Ricinus communis]|uniref:Uncharacterized protein n=1 Tax=Ricinus communis TaxID=3988 RepID=B9SHZ7_RICCO|nr:conserved hypothetical protein [Ricinus communis]